MKKDSPLTQDEIKKAARLFMLCMATQIDDIGSENEDESKMVVEAMESAHRALDEEFPTISHYLGSQSQCVEAIKGMRK
jgi:hypothetical protein